jgi:hypothetical protein
MLMVAFLSSTRARGQVVINEVVKEQRDAGGFPVPDTREFVELFNAGSSAIDIGNWSLGEDFLDIGVSAPRVIPTGTILAPGDFWVMGATGVPNLDQPLDNGTPTELLLDTRGTVLELRDSAGGLMDALAYETYRGSHVASATPEQLGQIGGGWWGEPLSGNVATPQSLSRWMDGRDTNNTGRDFGLLPATPGATNTLPTMSKFAVPNVDSAAAGSTLTSMHASFIQPSVIDPTVADFANPTAIPPSPQGGNAIVAWDPTGGGDATFSCALVNQFDVYAYIETAPLGVAGTSGQEEWETSVYGLGTTDSLFRNPNPTELISTDNPTRNGSTGVGWLYQRFEDPSRMTTFAKLLLVDFGNGGSSTPGGDWTILQTIDLDGAASGWRRLGISYDPATGQGTARFGEQTFVFSTEAGRVGTFYTGYREAVTGAPGPFLNRLRPPTFDMVPEPNGAVLGGLLTIGLGVWRRSHSRRFAGEHLRDSMSPLARLWRNSARRSVG